MKFVRGACSLSDHSETSEKFETIKPRLSFASITFSDGSVLSLEEDDIVVFVGPNNAGKSAALRELETWIAQAVPGKVIKNATIRKIGYQNDLKYYLEKNSQKIGINADLQYGGIGYSVHNTHCSFFDNEKNRRPVAPFFTRRMNT